MITTTLSDYEKIEVVIAQLEDMGWVASMHGCCSSCDWKWANEEEERRGGARGILHCNDQSIDACFDQAPEQLLIDGEWVDTTDFDEDVIQMLWDSGPELVDLRWQGELKAPLHFQWDGPIGEAARLFRDAGFDCRRPGSIKKALIVAPKSQRKCSR